MKTHELAKALLEQPDLELTASVDISTDESNAGDRAFGDQLNGFQLEGNYGAWSGVTLLFTSGYVNK